ncbi:MAG: patatin-like phospholipase family protein [Planctomycetaceae bacterium]|nr:patatin-like phospholipase family protein [Planctomycetaceae bacterium]
MTGETQAQNQQLEEKFSNNIIGSAESKYLKDRRDAANKFLEESRKAKEGNSNSEDILPADCPDYRGPKDESDTTGLALSGGGIRSASFNLGFVQYLIKNKCFLKFDYLSTVSGGGYLGGFLASQFAHAGKDYRQFESQVSPEDNQKQPQSVMRLIRCGRYLKRVPRFINRYLIGTFWINFWIFVALVWFGSLTAALFKISKLPAGGHILNGLGFQGDIGHAFSLSCISGSIWVLIWLIRFLLYFIFPHMNTRNSGLVRCIDFSSRTVAILSLVLFALGFVAVLVTGDIEPPEWQEGPNTRSFLNHATDWLTFVLVMIQLLALLPIFRFDELLKSGTKQRGTWQNTFFTVITTVILVGFPLFAFGYFAREDFARTIQDDRYNSVLNNGSLNETAVATTASAGLGVIGEKFVPENLDFRNPRLICRYHIRNWPLFFQLLEERVGSEYRNNNQQGETLKSDETTILSDYGPTDPVAMKLLNAAYSAKLHPDDVEKEKAFRKNLPQNVFSHLETLEKGTEINERGLLFQKTLYLSKTFSTYKKELPLYPLSLVKLEWWQWPRLRFSETKALSQLTELYQQAVIRQINHSCLSSHDFFKYFNPRITSSWSAPGAKGMNGDTPSNDPSDSDSSDNHQADRFSGPSQEGSHIPFRPANVVDYFQRASLYHCAHNPVNHDVPQENKSSNNSTTSTHDSPEESEPASENEVTANKHDPCLGIEENLSDTRQLNRRLLQNYFGPRLIQPADTIFNYTTIKADQSARWWYWGISSGIWVFLSLVVNLNRTSLHEFYRERLQEMWLYSSRHPRPSAEQSSKAIPQTQDEDNPLLFSNLRQPQAEDSKHPFPFLIINATANLFYAHLGNLVKSDIDSRPRQSRFEFNPLKVTIYHSANPAESPEETNGDSAETKYVQKRTEEDVIQYQNKLNSKLDLSSAMAISGSAVSPVMTTNLMFRILLFLSNIRFGQWLPKPNLPAARDKKFFRRHHASIARCLAESRIPNSEDRRYLFLSDGGHYENLGVEALLARRVEYILCVDASQDGDGRFLDLLKLIRRSRAMEGINITSDPEGRQPLDISCLDALKGHPAKRHFFEAYIQYPDRPYKCHFYYVKPSFDQDEPAEITNYKLDNPDFPHDPTLDQFYTERRFESYRLLGWHIAESFVKNHPEIFIGKQKSDSKKPPLDKRHRHFNVEIRELAHSVCVAGKQWDSKLPDLADKIAHMDENTVLEDETVAILYKAFKHCIQNAPSIDSEMSPPDRRKIVILSEAVSVIRRETYLWQDKHAAQLSGLFPEFKEELFDIVNYYQRRKPYSPTTNTAQ